MKIVKLSTLKAEEVLRLTSYLEKFAKTEDKKLFALSHLGNFFLNLSLEQSAELHDLVSENNIDGLKVFISNNPDIDVNLDGDSKISEIPGWKVKEEALSAIYKLAHDATHKTSKLKQIIRARELSCLENEKETDFNIEKFSSKILEEYDKSKINNYIVRLKDIIPVKNFLAKVFSYYKRTHAEYFVKYVFFHLDILMLDTKKESQITKTYIQTINNLCK